MPGEENLGELESMLGNADQGQGDQLSQPFVDDNGQGEQLLKTSSGIGTQNQGEKMFAGKYKTPQDLEKAYLSQNKGYNQIRSKQQQLEALIQNPRFQQMAANDPDMREALGKLGVHLQDEDARQDEREAGGAWNGDQNDPRFVAEVVRQENRLNWDMFRFEKKLGRDLSTQEMSSIKQQIVMAPRLSIEQAWKLTPHFEKELAAKHEKALEAAQRRAPVNRPKPVAPGSIGGPKFPQGKSPLGLKEDEKGEFLRGLMDPADRS